MMGMKFRFRIVCSSEALLLRACVRALECVWVGMFECMCLRFVVVVGT